MTALGIVYMHQTQAQREQLFEGRLDADRKARDLRLARTQKVCQQLRNLLGAQLYRAWWETAPEAGFLEVAEARLADLLKARWRLCSAYLYRGAFIWHDADGCFIIRDDGQLIPFIDDAEARGFVDATLAMSGSLLGALG